ncbi:MAG: hypothetical protein IJP66_07485 [Kiritimatiellae bacterium]|nr:hypothetical protein [Kiritimatiellia bacterium]
MKSAFVLCAVLAAAMSSPDCGMGRPFQNVSSSPMPRFAPRSSPLVRGVSSSSAAPAA